MKGVDSAYQGAHRLPLAMLVALIACSGCSDDSDGAPAVDGPVVVPPKQCWSDPSTEPVAEPNPSARADGFRLFYRERSERILRSVNRFALGGDVTMASFFGRSAVAKNGDSYEVVLGPNDNMPMGMSLQATYRLYQALGGRNFELTLIRMLRGAAFNEAVSGHPGLTTREALPGWTRIVDGHTNTVTRTRLGEPIATMAPAAPELEQEIIQQFYQGDAFTYRENPQEFFFQLMPLHETGPFAVTYVFSELDASPAVLRQSDCCSSFIRSERGPWAGAWWGNHNSRDNFTDLAMGFLTAMDIERLACVPDDLREAAATAAESGRRTGDRIILDGNVLTTVDEWHDYDTLTAAGWKNPDGEQESQDLGTFDSCAMIYLAHAISSDGLRAPVSPTPNPGEKAVSYVGTILKLMNFPSDETPETCNSIDEAFGGTTWKDLAGPKLDELLTGLGPDLVLGLVDSASDDFAEMMMAPIGLATYANMTGDRALYREAISTLEHQMEFQQSLADYVYADGDPDRIARVEQLQYMVGVYARMFRLDSPLSLITGFRRGEDHLDHLEAPLQLEDTEPEPLISDEEIVARVEARLEAITERALWRVERYRERFGSTPPVRRAGDGYEAIQLNGEWGPVENPRHRVFGFGSIDLWFEAALCMDNPQTLDCSWARLGCGHGDLDGNGSVDEQDIAVFESIGAAFPSDATCSDDNGWCDRADLDQSGLIDEDDRAFLVAAEGCTR
jgi:hypothetical protein